MRLFDYGVSKSKTQIGGAFCCDMREKQILFFLAITKQAPNGAVELYNEICLFVC